MVELAAFTRDEARDGIQAVIVPEPGDRCATPGPVGHFLNLLPQELCSHPASSEPLPKKAAANIRRLYHPYL